jgi:hypothetical protein
MTSPLGALSARGEAEARSRRIGALFAALSIIVALLVAACGGGSESAVISGVTIEPLASSTPRIGVPIGGKPAAPRATATPDATATGAPSDAATEAPPAAAATSTPEPAAGAPPEEGRWIDVDVTNYLVRLMDGTSVVRKIGPVGVGVAVDTGDYISTQTGLFYVHNKVEELVYDAPFDTYISHWVGFDPDKDNGFHSFLKDASGNVVDASTGRVSNGCIRTGEPDAIFAYAEIGMPVWVHW